ncbi:cation diffusion facilitator family transporter [Pseudoalteromonas luteoviolacea]|uniref:Zinc transporter n=1 Tax=Pseudoalteromonas luteoviolacea H33 TaxID=1365251 RepID=A0A162A9B5_9GAMM|nr:cation diffusion facilitator family transporter [Pseudoalteromonas luteoviolacea]KZN46153.1 zinc transporter [Pseudoalteromonas luteoviolacea H33]KZN75192.1 zinc transporter [Pseudoalteromonas luteoviolacea H33-S]MBQ4875792.1 cation transporter [Pseudoalteromonas luteoviolacea]MBQ4904827.1 cation transporter [Pseudoalteromonas luteoviolacea]
MTDLTTHEASRKRLLIALALTCTFMVIQLIGAYFANSLAVLADAGHLFVHNSSLLIALIASSIAVKLAKNFNEGYKKAEYTGGLINGILYVSIAVIILLEATERIELHSQGHVHEVNTFLMSTIAGVGFLFHGVAAWVLYKGRKDSINVYAVFLHSFFDLLSTVSTFVAGILIHLTGFNIIDVLSSMLISSFVLFTGFKVIKTCLTGLLSKESALPNVDKLEQAIVDTEHVESVHNVTVSNTDDELIVGAHIVLKHHCTIEMHDDACRFQVEARLKQLFSVEKCVLQIESHDCPHH